jgi:hypothetical protein
MTTARLDLMCKCTVHADFFDETCTRCKIEYAEMKGRHDIPQNMERIQRHYDKNIAMYKEFTEERAKKLYEQIILQYLGKSVSEQEAAERARSIVRKQCTIRGIEAWPWIR